MRSSRLVLAAFVLLFGLRTWSNRGYFGLQRTPIAPAGLAEYLPFSSECTTSGASAPVLEPVLGTVPTYLQLISQLSATALSQHQTELASLADRSDHELARLLALEAIVPDADDPVAWVEVTQALESNERLHVAEFFLSQAGRCFLQQDLSRATDLLEIGGAILPAGAEDELEPILSRRVADIYFVAEEWELARLWYERAPGTGGTPTVRIAQILVKQGDLHGALTAYETALAYYPDRVELLLEAAQVAVNIEAYDRASIFLNRLDRTQMSVTSLFSWASMCETMGDLNCAIDLYRRILEQEPSNAPAHQGLDRLQFIDE